MKNSNLTKLRDYQQEDVKFLKKLEVAGCFNEPRTGKTPTAHIPKTIYELCIKGTYDEQCYDLVEKRAQSVDAINNFKLYMKGGN